MQKFWKEPQNIIALGVTLISVCALIVSIAQTRVMNKQSELMDVQARASVRPILLLGINQAFDAQTGNLIEYQIQVTNGGVGPATVDDVHMAYNGNTVRNWGELFLELGLNDSIPTYVDNRRLSKSIIQAGESAVILDLSSNLALARVVHAKMNTVVIRVVYSSIYGDQFELRIDETGTKNQPVTGAKAGFGEDGFED